MRRDRDRDRDVMGRMEFLVSHLVSYGTGQCLSALTLLSLGVTNCVLGVGVFFFLVMIILFTGSSQPT
jgi:hypothetical protein